MYQSSHYITKNILMIHIWVWLLWYESECFSMKTKSTQGSGVHKVDDEGKMFIVVVKPSLLLTLTWPVTWIIMQNQITPVDTLFWYSDKWTNISSLWTVVGDHPVADRCYSPHNISDDTSVILIYCEYIQRLMIWYGLQPYLLFIYEDIYLVFVVTTVKDSVVGCLYELHQFPPFF